MMPTFREVIDVPVPVEQAFAYVSDFTTAAQWDPGITRSRRVGGGGGVGTTYAVDAEFRGKSIPFTYVVTAFEQNSSIALHGKGAKAVSDDTITFAELPDGGTRITYEAEIRLTGILRLAERFIETTVSEMGAKALAGLQEALTPAP